LNDQLMTTKEVSNYLQISIWTLYRWIKQKNMPVIKLGGLDRFRKNELDEWINNINSCKNEKKPF